MTRFSASVATAGFALLLFAAAVPTQIKAQQPAQEPVHATVSVSKIRIVRVSEVRGAVELDRRNGYEPAIANLPVVEANRLKTAVGVAEVEFEDNSTLRLGPNSEVEFPQLGRTAEGGTVSAVRLVKGIAYVSLLKPSGKVANQFDLIFGDRKIPLDAGTHVRLETDGQQAKLAVLSGTLRLDGSNGAIEVPHKKMATFALADHGDPVVGKTEDSGPLDAWDKQNTQYHERVASLSAFNNVPYSYGLSDMMYYGAFSNIGGCGMMWRPYFTSAGWDPYSSGSWAYYQGVGYSWVSPYPWGWTPYHYGSWSFCPGAGWGWMPGGSWMGLSNVLYATTGVPTGLRNGGPRLPVAPHPPKSGEPTLVSVNQSSLVRSSVNSQAGSFVFRRDSAGLGIPRNELGNLKDFSQHTVQKGTVSTPVYATVGTAAPGAVRSGTPTFAPVSIRRGSSPPAPSSGSVGAFSPGGRSAMGPAISASAPSLGASRPSAPSSPHH